MSLPLVLPEVLGQLLAHGLVEPEQRQGGPDGGGRGSSWTAFQGGGRQVERTRPPLAFTWRTLLRRRSPLLCDATVSVLNVAVVQGQVPAVLQSPVVEGAGAVLLVLRRLGAGQRRRRPALCRQWTRRLEVAGLQFDG